MVKIVLAHGVISISIATVISGRAARNFEVESRILNFRQHSEV